MTATDTDDTDAKRSVAEKLDEHLTNSEMVLMMLAENNGKLTQQELLDKLPWFSSKMTEVISAMKAEEKIVKVDFGPTHIVMLPMAVPDIME
ncbi:hypothetical protein [Haloferax sp. YSSS75]|uniref:DUF7343 domain-containing protein n=1 Tax=Haloferax sp. YSSS75 TaxID=3388564 RepID=UPI00398C9DD7